MRFDAYSVWCGQAACTTYSWLSMRPNIYLCVGDIRVIVNWLAAGGPDSRVASMMDNNSPFLVEFVVIEQAYEKYIIIVIIIIIIIISIKSSVDRDNNVSRVRFSLRHT
jgi:hypothetical protein